MIKWMVQHLPYLLRSFYALNCGSCAVVVMDNLPAHKLTSIVPMIESVGASVIGLSPYSPDFNPIEMWWPQLKSFLRRFAPQTSAIIDRIIAVAINLMDTNHLRH